MAGRILVNYMAQLTAHDERTSALMVDILDDNDTLYSGLYSEYHMEDGKLASISLTNVVCFGFKSEKARKEARIALDGADGQDPLPYILPNQGQMCFPISNVQNFHFWRIVQNRNFKLLVDSPRNQVMLAWYVALKYAVPRLNLGVTALVADPSEDVTIFLRMISRLRLNLDLIDVERVGTDHDNDDQTPTPVSSTPPSSPVANS